MEENSPKPQSEGSKKPFKKMFVGTYNLGVFGSAHIGKIEIIERLISSRFFEEYDPTIEDSFRKQVVIDQFTCLLEIFDANENEYPTVQEILDLSDGFLFVYSITNRASLDELRNVHGPQVQKAASKNYIVVGNDCEREESRQVGVLEGLQYAASINALFVETSAKKGINVERAFYDLVRLIWRTSGTKQQIPTASQAKPVNKKCYIC